MGAVTRVQIMCGHCGAALIMAAGIANADIGTGLRERCPAYVSWLMQRHAKDPLHLEPVVPDAAPSDPGLREELLSMMRADQDARAAVDVAYGPDDPAVRRVIETDEANLARVKLIIALFGFARSDQVGHDGTFAVWLLVQHAGTDLAFQALVLERIQPLVD
jgi:hypothetical protein